MVEMWDYPDDAAGKLTPVERSCVKLVILAATGCVFLLAIVGWILARIL